VILTSLHALCTVESFGVLVVGAIDVHTHIQDFVSAAAWALLCFVKPIGLLGDVRRIHRVNLLIEAEHEELSQVLLGCRCGQRVVSMIHI